MADAGSVDALGPRGEDIAARHLRRSGMRILDRNWRCREGELDIVAGWGRTLVAVEVKTRTSGRFGYPLEAVTPAKLARIRRLIRIWRSNSSQRFRQVRIDVLCVLRTPGGRWYVQHHRGVG